MVQKLKNLTKKPIVVMGIFIVIAVAMILIGFLACKVPLVSVCTIVILEALLAALLNKIPIWVHGILVIAQIVAGIIFGKAVFMILMAVVYVAAILLLYLWSARDE